MKQLPGAAACWLHHVLLFGWRCHQQARVVGLLLPLLLIALLHALSLLRSAVLALLLLLQLQLQLAGACIMLQTQ